MNESIGLSHAYRLFAYDKAVDDSSDLHSFVATAGVRENWLQNLDLTSARAARFDDFLVARGEMRNATLVWTRARQSAQRRYMFYFVNRGALQVSGSPGTRRTDGHGVGLIYPGRGSIALTTIIESDFTVFTFDAKAVYPATLDPDAGAELPAASPVLWSASAFLNGLLSAQAASRLQSAQVLRRMTADIAVSLLAEARKDREPDGDTETILQIIALNFTNPLFTTASICRDLRMGRRTLERVCATAGFSPAEMIRVRRAEHALNLLLAQPTPHPEHIWAQSGFSSSEAMRRAFLRFYGKTTRELFIDGKTANKRVEIDDMFPAET